MPRDSGESIFSARHQDVSQGPLGRKDFPPIFSANLGLKRPFVRPRLDFPDNCRDTLWTNLGFGAFLNAVKGRSAHNLKTCTCILKLNSPALILSKNSGVSSAKIG